MVHNATLPKQDIRICLRIAAETRDIPNRAAWHTIGWELQELGFQGTRMVQMRDAVWRERQTVITVARPSIIRKDAPLDPTLRGMLEWLQVNHPQPGVTAILENAAPDQDDKP